MKFIHAPANYRVNFSTRCSLARKCIPACKFDTTGLFGVTFVTFCQQVQSQSQNQQHKIAAYKHNHSQANTSDGSKIARLLRAVHGNGQYIESYRDNWKHDNQQNQTGRQNLDQFCSTNQDSETWTGKSEIMMRVSAFLGLSLIFFWPPAPN